ncbi:MAG: hypothetical protein JRC86_12285 [Deltaproteobacteria bacterium]|nr:hypothetical protein [Deltaproteobacteria bacterium]
MAETGKMSEARAGDGSVLAEIIRTPLFKDMLNNYLREIDPRKGSATAKVILWEDPQLVLSLLASIPPMVNWIVAFLGELGNQTSDKFPPQLVKGYMANMWEDIDRDAMEECLKSYGRLIKGLLDESPEFQRALLEAIKGPVAIGTGMGINSAVKYVNDINRQDPVFLKKVFSGVVSTVDGKEFAEASTSLVNAALDQKPPLVSWVWHLLKVRIKRKFGRQP